jgi:hypothetical protein
MGWCGSSASYFHERYASTYADILRPIFKKWRGMAFSGWLVEQTDL